MTKNKPSKAPKSNNARVESGPPEAVPFIPYPKVIAQLVRRFGSTPEELAAWVSMGPDLGGLAAYAKPKKHSQPSRVYFDVEMGEDYVSPLMGCWFKVKDIEGFEPSDRYISGRALVQRWAPYPNIKPLAYIAAKIAESRLLDMHPTFGLTQASGREKWYPPIEEGLFSLSRIMEVEAEDFGVVGANIGNGRSVEKESPLIGSPEWRRKNASAAAVARHSQKGGTRDKRAKLLERWASGGFKSRDHCARVVSEELGMSFSTARKLLIGIPDVSKT